MDQETLKVIKFIWLCFNIFYFKLNLNSSISLQMEHSSLPTTSFSSLNNINTKYNTDYISIPILNHKQIILDWINTINEPTCLLVSSISDLQNGNVFIEILKHYLHMTNHNELMYDLLSQDITTLNPVQKVKIAIDFFIKINQNNNYTEQLFHFKQLAHNVYTNEELLIDFLSLLKNIYENINNEYINDDTVLNTVNSELDDSNMKKYTSSNNYFNYMNQVKTISTVNDNVCSNGQEQECISYIDNNNNITPIVIKDKQTSFDVRNENTFHCLSSLHQQYMTNKCVSLHKPTRNVKCNLNLKQNTSMPKLQQPQYLPKNRTTYINSTYNNSINISATPSTQITPKKIKLNKKRFESLSNINNIHRKTNSNANTSFTSATNDISFSISNNTPKYTNNNNNKSLYSKSQKAIINMTRGMIHIHNKLFTLEYNSLKLNHLQFIKPSEPIININYNNIRKYKIISNPTKHSSPNNIKPPLNNNSNQPPLQPTTTTVPLKRNIPSSSSSKTFTPIPKSLHQSFNNTDIPDDNCGISSSVKIKIYKWLVNIGIIKNNTIPINEIPTICINGVLLCDLINRCEGKNETIKGITRKTKTKSHIQVNINKVLEYLRSKEKFNSSHLWNGNEIAIGNKKIIWELLEDIMNFY